MLARASLSIAALLALVAACSGAPGGAHTTSSSSAVGGAGGAESPGGAGGSASTGGAGGGLDYGLCSVGGVPGECIEVSACEAMPGHGATPGYCPGPADIQCCTQGPSVSDNPPVPDGWKLMMQSEVTPEMTDWAVSILQDPVTYPMFSTTTMVFGALTVMARVEWHPPDFQNDKVHRGVTLYKPA